MVGGYPVTDKTKWHGEGLVHVNFDMWDLVHDPVRGVEAGGPGADNGKTERGVLRAWGEDSV